MSITVWIDGFAEDRLRVFALTLLQRHLCAVRRMRGAVCEVRISLSPGSRRPDLPHPLAAALPLHWVEEGGSPAARLGACLAAAPGPVLALSGGSVVDPRLLDFMAASQEGNRLARSETGTDAPVLLRLEPGAADWFAIGSGTLEAAACVAERDGRLAPVMAAEFPSFIVDLRRDLPFYVIAVRNDGERRRCERFLFWSNYKGSTDFLTKWVFPPAVRLAVPALARWRVHPHWVTLISLLACLLAIPFFAAGRWLPGLALAYMMALCDSIDGKLARLTFTDSRLGRFLDHGLDLVHPPFWYLAWAAGLALPLAGTPALLVVLYWLDRLVLATYRQRFKRPLHTHSRLDAALRTVISRRNPNLFIFTVGLILGQGALAFQAIVAWQGLTLLYHAARTVAAIAGRGQQAAVAPTGKVADRPGLP